MGRRVGHRDGEIVLVTSDPAVVKMAGSEFVRVPKELDGLSDADIFAKCVVRDGVVVDKTAPRDPKSLRVAMVGAWGIPCGIATYAEALWPKMGAEVKEWVVYAEAQDGVVAGPNVVAGLWKRGESMGRLAAAIEEWRPDAVFIQHEYGIFPDARHWLSFLSRIGTFRPIVTLHSVYWHKDKTICEAPIPEIVVHSDLARDVLRKKGVTSRIEVIHHGCGHPRKVRLFNLYRSKHAFMQIGFGFRYKNWEASIDAVAILKKKYPDVFFTGLFSEGLFSKREHDRYHAELMARAAHLSVRDHVAILRGYKSEEIVDAFLGTNQAAVFPYRNDPDHVVFGASGAARRAMEAQLPVIVSKVPHFADFGGVCPQVDTAEGLAEALDALFSSPKSREAAVAAQNAFLEHNSWENVAAAYLALV